MQSAKSCGWAIDHVVFSLVGPGTRSDPQLDGAVVGDSGQRRRPRFHHWPGVCGVCGVEALNDVN